MRLISVTSVIRWGEGMEKMVDKPNIHTAPPLGSTELYDVFISHASEDKEAFVRPLAHRLEEEHVAVWFDEFSLNPGDGLRRSIDLGLSRSRIGIVVLSRSFFEKGWPQRELDGLVAREMIEGRRIVIPIWHGVSKEEVCAFSPPLADTVAILSSRGLESVVHELMKVIRPVASPLIIARDILFDYGLKPPVVTDEWWLEMVTVSNWLSSCGFIPDCGEWGRWSFPLPDDLTPEGRGKRIAWAAMQLAWSEAATKSRISQISSPTDVLEFICSYPGLREVCHTYPDFLAAYAPQLTIPGLSGEFEEDFDRVFEDSKREYRRYLETRTGTGLTVKGEPPCCSEFIALRDPGFADFRPSFVAGSYFQGELNGPPNRVYENMDYIVWLLSCQGSWIPPKVRAFLLDGMKCWSIWPWADDFKEDKEFGLLKYEGMGALLESLLECQFSGSDSLCPLVLDDIIQRIAASIELLKLPEGAEELTQRFLKVGFIEAYIQGKEERGKRRSDLK
jgi:hypothetical protein